MVDKSVAEPVIPKEVLDAILDAVLDGRYHLLLGAGSTRGCTNSVGNVPDALALKRLLLEEAGDDPDEGITLALAYETAVAVLGPDYVTDLLRSRYSNVVPHEWHRLIPAFPWEAIWTFNIDDSVDGVYRTASKPVQRGRTYLWQDETVPLGGTIDALPIVHLHGYVGAIDPRDDPQLIFGWDEYLAARSHATRTNWHTRFRSEYSTSPVIIVGASLSDEIDFAEVIRHGNSSARYGAPSLVVSPNLTDGQIARFKRWGLEPIVATGEDFIRELNEAVDLRLAGEDTTLHRSRYTDRTFFRLTPLLADEDETAGHDFYGGHEPVWRDILADLDAVPAWIQALCDGIGDPAADIPFQRLFLLCGAPFSGKSTALLRVARELQNRGWEPFYLGGREILDVQETLDFFESRPNAFLLIDSVHFDVNDIEQVFERAEARRQRLLVVGADRTQHLVTIKRSIRTRYLAGASERIFVEPNDRLWMGIVEKRGERARLGRVEGLSEMRLKQYFTQNGRDLYTALASLEDAPGFIDRGLQVIQDLPLDVRTAFCAIGLAGSLDLRMPASAAANVSGLSVPQLLDACSPGGALGEWVALDRHEVGLLALRHRYLGDLMIQHRSRLTQGPALGALSADVCIVLSDRVSIEAIRQKRLEYRIVAGLMDFENVRSLVNADSIDTWYDRLEPYYSWNARYWEQRSLSLHDAHERAFSYASRAVSLHHGPFTLNTLGTVLMRRAIDEARGQSDAGWPSYWVEACDALRQSRDSGGGRFEHPYMTYFAYTRRLLNILGVDSTWAEAAAAESREWRASAKEHRLMEDRVGRALLRSLPENWWEA